LGVLSDPRTGGKTECKEKRSVVENHWSTEMKEDSQKTNRLGLCLF